MRNLVLGTCIVAALAVSSCDVFVSGVGGDGETCAMSYGECFDGLVCNHGICGPPKSLGESCDGPYMDWDSLCEDGLSCVEGLCVESGDLGEPCHSSPYDDIAYCDGDLGCLEGICVELGGSDQPCEHADPYHMYGYGEDHGSCDDELQCLAGVCREVGGVDQVCGNYEHYEDTGICDPGLRCVEGRCRTPQGSTVAQPNNLSKVWQRCPAGMSWDGWVCIGEYTDVQWDQAAAVCPSGFNVPSVADFVSLLDDCDAKARNYEDNGFCAPCDESPVCAEMFLSPFMDSSSDAWVFMQAAFWASNSSCDVRLNALVYTIDCGYTGSTTLPVLCVSYGN